MPEIVNDAEIVMASALRVRGADLIELAGSIMCERSHGGKVNTYYVERIGHAIADLATEFAKFQAAQKSKD